MHANTVKNTKRSLTLYQAIALLIFAVIAVSLFFSYFLVARNIKDVVNGRLGANAQQVVKTIQSSPEIVKELSQENSNEKVIAPIVNTVSKATNASIVIFDAKQKIVAIYNPTSSSMTSNNSGEGTIKSFEGLPANFFKNHAVEKILAKDGKVIGYIIVGFPDDIVGGIKKDIENNISIASAIGFFIGVLGSYILAQKIKKILFNREPSEIASLLVERNALIENVTEGIFAIKKDLNIQFINKSGIELLKKASIDDYDNLIGKSFALITDVGEIKKVLESGNKKENIEMNFYGYPVIADILPVKYEAKIVGIIVSTTEKVAMQTMAEKLSGVSNYADALRAQTHEFMNKMHVINGLLSTGEIEELKKYINHVSNSDELNTEEITNYIKEPLLSGFLIGKKSRANELQVEFHLENESFFPETCPPNFSVHDIILIVGNLLENSFDVLRHQQGDRIVNLSILTYDDEEIIVVENNGPMIPKEIINKIFEKGFSTKGDKHGFGLALIQEKVDYLGGKIITESDENSTTFTVQLPIKGEKIND